MTVPTPPDFPFRLVDLTHPLTPGMPVWPGDPATTRQEIARLDRDGWNLSSWTISEHAGTHFGAPAHFRKGGVTVDAIPVSHLLWPVVVLDITRADLPDGSVTIEQIRSHEVGWGHLVPEGAMILLRTGWDKRWPDPEQLFEKDEAGRYKWPGFSLDAVIWLIKERKAAGLGTDAPGIDAGADLLYEAGHGCASQGLPHLENLANLDKLPTSGGWILAAPLPFVDGSGSPARVIGLVP